MANGPALSQEDQELLAKVDAAQAQAQPQAQTDELIGALSSPDRMQVEVPTKPEYQGERGEKNLAEDVAKYKEETGDIDLDGKKDGMWKRFKRWWNIGVKDDPTTIDVDEGDPNTEITKFMGGMTRQELSMFLFEWGGLMMANADQGFGGAMGAAGLGAMQGHQARQDRKTSQMLQEQEMEINRRALAETGESDVDEQGYKIEQYYDKDSGEMKWRRALDESGEAFKVKDPRQYQGEKAYILDFARRIGKTDEEVWAMWSGAITEDDRRSFFERELGNLVEQATKNPSLMPNQGVDPVTGKKYNEMSPADKAEWVERHIQEASRARQATEALRRAQRGALGE